VKLDQDCSLATPLFLLKFPVPKVQRSWTAKNWGK